MVKTLATLVFIGGVAAGAIGLARAHTVIDGKVMAEDLLGQLRSRGITEVHCDDRIPIGQDGAVFTCLIGAPDGSTANLEYTMDRAGALTAKVLDSTGPTHERVPASSDPWAN